MTFDECREHAGERVTYLAGSLFPGDGAIAAYPEELTLQEAVSE